MTKQETKDNSNRHVNERANVHIMEHLTITDDLGDTVINYRPNNVEKR